MLQFEGNHREETEQDFYEDHQDSLLNAIERGDIEAVKGTLNVAAINDENEKEEYPLGLAAKLGHIEIVKYLLAQGAELKNVLHEACKGESIEMVNYLTAPVSEGGVGIDVNQATIGRWTPLHFSSSCGAEKITRHLISIGAIVDGLDDNQLTPLSLACRSRYHTIVKLLIDAGANINLQNKYGETPLHRAAAVGGLLVIKVLLDAGANINIKDKNGLTPFDVADEMGQKECALCLWESGGQTNSSIGYEFGTLEWQRSCFKDLPSPRYSHSCCILGSKIYLTGGYGIFDQFNSLATKPAGNILNDFYVLDTNKVEKTYIVDIHQSKTTDIFTFDQKKSHFLAQFSEDMLRAKFKGETEKHRRCGVISNFPFVSTKECSFGYFEVTIIDSGDNDCVCIGLCDAKYGMDRQPGWDFSSWGYHGDDGRCYHNKGNGSLWGPTYTTGDVIGCGINFKSGEIFFSKNGVFLGVAFNDGFVDFPVYPMIGLMEGADVRINFGQGKQPFKFDFEACVYNWKKINLPKKIAAFLKIEKSNIFPLSETEILFWGYSLVIYNTETNQFTQREEKTTWNCVKSDDKVLQKIGNKIYVFYKSSSKFMYYDLEDWKFHMIEATDETPAFRDLGNSKIYSVVVDHLIHMWHSGEDEVYTFNTQSNVWSYCKPTGTKPLHEQYSCTEMGDKIIIFGGWDNRKQQNDVFILDTKQMHWYKPHIQGQPFPRPRNNHSAVAVGKNIFFIGGWNGSTFIPDIDVLECDIEKFKKLELCSYAFDNQSFSDIALVSGGQSVVANKIILSSRSEYFRKLCFEEPDLKSIDLSHIPFNILYSIVEYMYKEEVNVSRIGCDREGISKFLGAVHNLCPTVKPHLMEKLILTRTQLNSIFFEELSFAWNNPSFSDLTLIVSGVEFPVHKCILSCRSKYFRALLSSGLAESRKTEIILDEHEGSEEEGMISPDVFKYVLEYIYNDFIEINDEINELVVPILICSSKYGVTGCQETVEDLIAHNLDIENVLSLTLVADRYRAFKLAKSCLEFISHPNNIDIVFNSEEYLDETNKVEYDRVFGSNFYDEKKKEQLDKAIEEFENVDEKDEDDECEEEEENEDDEEAAIGRLLNPELRQDLQRNGCLQQ